MLNRMAQTKRNNFGLWLYDWCGNEEPTTYSTIRKLSRLFTMACDQHNVNKFAYDTPEKLREHLAENGADDVVIKALETATNVWRLKYHNYLKHVYSRENFENFP